MNFYEQYDQLLSPEEMALVAKAQAFCTGAFSEEVLLSFRESRPFDSNWIQSWAKAGFLGLQAAPEHGGYGASFLCKVRIAQTMAKHSFAAAFAINNLQGSVTRLSHAGSDVQRAKLMEPARSGALLCAGALTEPSGGSDLSALATTALPVEGGWILNGVKDWVTNGDVVGLVTLLAKVQAQDGTTPIASFLTQLSNTTTVRREVIDLPGALSFRLARLTFRDHFVPQWAQFGAPGQALKASMAAVNAARVHVAAMCVASLHAALREAVDYCAGRQAFGKAVLDHQGLRWELAEVALRLEAANALTFKAARLVQDGKPSLTAAAQSKKFAVDTAIWGIDQCIRAMGAVGATGSHRLNMLFAEVRMAAFGDGTNQILLDRIGKGLRDEYGNDEIGN